VTIPHALGTEAHSDGDVLLHALMDALLGALALGDIGEHFPPSDPAYRDADSLALLAHVKSLVEPGGYEITNIDSTIVLEEPKLKPYKQAIRASIANALGLDISQVSVKAKTMEKIDAIGRGEAIASSVSVLLTRSV
jgi:2-C-methyl-D-erythritol 2,4-cyclodiphosphate synthase